MRKTGAWIITVLTIVASIIVILQFFGFTHLQDLLPRSSSAPMLVSESTYSTASPLCDKATDPSDMSWQTDNSATLCQPADAGTWMVGNVPQSLGALLLQPNDQSATFSTDAVLEVTVSQINPGLDTIGCAGIIARSGERNSAYGFEVCTDGSWAINKYTTNHGQPTVALQSNTTNMVPRAERYDMRVVVNAATLQMTINSSPAYTTTDTSYSIQSMLGVYVHSGESAIFSNFSYTAA